MTDEHFAIGKLIKGNTLGQIGTDRLSLASSRAIVASVVVKA
jgi:hypothetical protein